MIASQALPAARASPDYVVLASGKFSFRVVVRGLIYAVLFVAAMQVVVDLARFGASVTPIWIASAILTWALISSPVRDWPILVAMIAAAHIARAIVFGDHPATEAVYLVANVGGPLACAALLNRFSNGAVFEDRNTVGRFLLVAGIAGPLVSTAVVFVGTFIDPSRFKVDDLRIWFLSDALSYVVFLPIFRAFSTGNWREVWKEKTRAKAALLFGILVVALAADWVAPDGFRRVFPILIIPYLVFLVFELGPAGARGAVLFPTISFVAYALLQSESARRGMPPAEYILQVQIYLAAVAACVLPLAAALAEKQRLYDTAAEALEDAQSAWGSLIAAEAHYRLIADNARDMVMRLGLDGSVIFASPACIVLSADAHDLEGRKLLDLVHEEDSTRVRSDIEAFMSAGVLDHPHTIRMRLRDAGGGWRPFDVIATLVSSRGSKPEEVIAVLREVVA